MLKYAEQNLFSFYQQSYNKHLGIQLPDSLDDIRLYNSFDSYLQNAFSQNQIHQVKQRLHSYRTGQTLQSKTLPLVNFVKNSHYRPRALLDFGCGRGETMQFLAENLDSLEELLGIDVDEHVLNQCQQALYGLNAKITLSTVLEEPHIAHKKNDLIIIVHTLHHIDRKMQCQLLDTLLSQLKPHGLLYIYEDSWSMQSQVANKLIYDVHFQNLQTSLVFPNAGSLKRPLGIY